MSRQSAELAAAVSCFFMWKHKFKPKTILNCGIGRTSPELDIWKWLLPDVARVGIDPRWSPQGYWTRKCGEKQLKVALGSGDTGTATYCGDCRGTKCRNPVEHTKHKSQVTLVTLDAISAALEPPFFIWMDIDGSEVDALKGATNTLNKTGMISVECEEQLWGKEHAEQITALLVNAGFKRIHNHANCTDRLFWNRRVR